MRKFFSFFEVSKNEQHYRDTVIFFRFFDVSSSKFIFFSKIFIFSLSLCLRHGFGDILAYISVKGLQPKIKVGYNLGSNWGETA